MSGPRGRALVPSLATALAVTALVCWTFWNDRHASGGWLTSTLVITADLAVTVGGCAGAALLAWLVSPLHAPRHRDAPLLSARTPLARLRFAVSRSAVWSAAVLLLSLSSAVGISAATVGLWADGMDLLAVAARLVSAWAWLTALCLVGAAVGRWVPARLAPAVAGVLAYATFVAATRPSGTSWAHAARLLSLDGQSAWHDVAPSPLASGLRLLLAVLVAAALVGIAVGSLPTTALASGAALALVITAAPAAAPVTPERLERGETGPLYTATSQARVCARDASAEGEVLTVCGGLPESGALATHARQVRESAAALPAALRPEHVTTSPEEAAEGRSLLVPLPQDGGPTGGAGTAAAVDRELARAVFERPCLPTEEELAGGSPEVLERLASERVTARTVLYYAHGVLRGHRPAEFRDSFAPPVDQLEGGAEVAARAEAFAALSEGERDAWWREHLPAVQGCTLTLDELPQASR
ncbi:hypothetical protein M3C74_08270 [Micrococcus lylae]|uniref:Uncharacterized protein n=1 Tax=Micrococcus lylae TaxID=1273 RepID=A0ABY2K180_9MICC|nr:MULTISPECIES: hypothetical protein [Micrococcus]MCT2007675.1 hypothetical protein [Micrococcus lylae]MCT2071821.1 hypothetical protein [Micrococcus lylae]OFR91134.1 hypothetical protein HMPREF2863_05080 [Micrococcus sp. HMSC067E09]TFH98169.1 hypothetical protein E4A49_09835 [Micrococcus lylae]WIK81263.1 hypothetical protein CJ228_006465 [Micrococcus lylae]